MYLLVNSGCESPAENFLQNFFDDRSGTLSEKTTAWELHELYLNAPQLFIVAVISQLQFTMKSYEKIWQGLQAGFFRHSSKNHGQATESHARRRANLTRFYLTARKFFSCNIFSELSYQIVYSYLLSKLLWHTCMKGVTCSKYWEKKARFVISLSQKYFSGCRNICFLIHVHTTKFCPSDFYLAKYTGNDSKHARQISTFHMPVGFFKMYFMLGLFCLVFWLTELPIFLEMVFSNSQRLQRCLLGSGQLITTKPTDSGLSYCFNSIALSYPKPHLLGKSQKCCLLWSMVLILSQLFEKTKD